MLPLEQSRAYFTEDRVNVSLVASGLDPAFLLVNRKLILVQVNKKPPLVSVVLMLGDNEYCCRTTEVCLLGAMILNVPTSVYLVETETCWTPKTGNLRLHGHPCRGQI